MDTPEADVVVAGAGPAGLAAARCLLAEGLRVVVADPGLPPAPRIESLPANGIALAESLGLAPALSRAGLGRAAWMQLCWREGPETRDFGAEGPLLLDRVSFHAALRGLLPPGVLRAGRVTSLRSLGDVVQLRLGGTELCARVVIDARGRAGLRTARRVENPLAALGFSGWSEALYARPFMLLESLAEGWLWACMLPGGRLSGSVFLPAASLAARGMQGRAALLARLLDGSALGIPSGLSAGQAADAMLRVADDPFASPRVIRIGDAALARDPVASHGLVHALRSGAQAAAAAATLLDPDGDAEAARSFIRGRHQEAAMAAEQATALSLAGQARHHTAFWKEAAATPPAPPAAVQWPALSRPLALAPLRRAAVLEQGRIHWDEAVWLARSGQAASRFGNLTASRLAGLLSPPAPIALLSARLERVLEPALAQGILRQLLDEGSLFDAGQAAADASSA